jgi:hypothetical protein
MYLSTKYCAALRVRYTAQLPDSKYVANFTGKCIATEFHIGTHKLMCSDIDRRHKQRNRTEHSVAIWRHIDIHDVEIYLYKETVIGL